MKSRSYGLSVIVLLTVFILSTACTVPTAEMSGNSRTTPTQTPAVKTVETVTDVDKTPSQGDDAASAGMPNPASVYCEETGYKLDIRTDADGGQYGVCIFPNGSECEEWAFFREECQPAVDMTGWTEYANLQYGFAFRMPPDWALEEVQGPDNTMAGHQVKLHIQPEAGRKIEMMISFKWVDEDRRISPTGVGNGEFVARGTTTLIGQAVNRNVLVCEGRDMSVYYQQEGSVRRGDLDFALILVYVGNCMDGYSIPAEIQSMVDAVVASFVLLP